MSELSIVRPDRTGVTCVANAVFLTKPLRTETGTEVTFEVLAEDARRLFERVGSKQLYYLDDQVFWAELKSLEPCRNTHPELSSLRDTPTFHGVFFVMSEQATAGTDSYRTLA